MDASQLSVFFFLQMFFILAVCRGVGWLARQVGQPQVVGEMIAGVLLGPSLFGLLLPEYQQIAVPERDAQDALCRGAAWRRLVHVSGRRRIPRPTCFTARARSAASVSLAGMLAPFGLAVLLAPWLLAHPGLFSDKATLYQAILFLGAAISITAFPMLARIIYERGLTGTALGTLALSAGAIDDAAAWCVLAIVLASFGGGAAVAVKAIAGGVAYAVIRAHHRIAAVDPARARLVEQQGKMSNSMLGVVLMALMLGVWTTDAIGIHAVFGGFLLGAAMPRGLFARELQQKLEPFAVVFLLPMFFTFSGLNTRLDAVTAPT